MARQASHLSVAMTLVVTAFAGAGCLGVGQIDDIDQTRMVELQGGTLLAEPEVASLPADHSHSAYQTLHNNGMLWAAINAATVQNGDLGAYDVGDGMFFGVAFGNESVKQFFEFSYEESKGHTILGQVGTADGASADAIHRRFYMGIRRYLRPITGQTSRVVPFVVSGLSYHTLDNYGAGDALGEVLLAEIDDATGMGVYAGTGLEIYLSAQITLGLDLRMSYWNWEGSPEATGENGTASASAGVYYHF